MGRFLIGRFLRGIAIFSFFFVATFYLVKSLEELAYIDSKSKDMRCKPEFIPPCLEINSVEDVKK